MTENKNSYKKEKFISITNSNKTEKNESKEEEQSIKSLKKEKKAEAKDNNVNIIKKEEKESTEKSNEETKTTGIFAVSVYETISFRKVNPSGPSNNTSKKIKFGIPRPAIASIASIALENTLISLPSPQARATHSAIISSSSITKIIS